MKKYFQIPSLILILLINLNFSSNLFAQSGKEDDQLLQNSGRDISIVVGAGAAGAILGLSTLSFVEKPGDHLKNIVVGGSIGIIIGVAVVAWTQASSSTQIDNYGDKRSTRNEEEGVIDSKEKFFSFDKRMSWNSKIKEQIGILSLESLPQASINFPF
jgi:hypothetical protein